MRECAERRERQTVRDTSQARYLGELPNLCYGLCFSASLSLSLPPSEPGGGRAGRPSPCPSRLSFRSYYSLPSSSTLLISHTLSYSLLPPRDNEEWRVETLSFSHAISRRGSLLWRKLGASLADASIGNKLSLDLASLHAPQSLVGQTARESMRNGEGQSHLLC